MFLYDLHYVCKIMLLFIFFLYFYSFTVVLFSECSIIKLGLDGTALVNAIYSKIGIMIRAVKQGWIRSSSH